MAGHSRRGDSRVIRNLPNANNADPDLDCGAIRFRAGRFHRITRRILQSRSISAEAAAVLCRKLRNLSHISPRSGSTTRGGPVAWNADRDDSDLIVAAGL